MSDEFSAIKQKRTNCKAERENYVAIWEDISRYVAIKFVGSIEDKENATETMQLDEDIYDPTIALSVQQAGDYMQGVLWGTGDDAMRIKPSRYVLQKADLKVVQKWFEHATEEVLYQMNHPRANLSTAMMSYSYAEWAFGTAGIGALKNHSFFNGVDDNCITFRNYDIGNMSMAEGSSGKIEYLFPEHYWTTSHIVREFCFKSGVLDDASFSRLPDKIKDSYNAGKLNDKYTVIAAIYPRDEFDPKLQGKRGARYKGVWYMENDETPFSEDDYREFPIPVCRMIKVPNEIYGRSPATIMFSMIRMLNFIMGKVIVNIEKLNDPSLGVYDGSLTGDSVLDDSAGSINVFNPKFAQNGGSPTFPLYQVGDIAPLVQFLVPYLKEQLTSAAKVDDLLDFNSDKEMTAQEANMRYIIRGKSLAGLLTQQKNEMLIPLIKRCISLCELAEVLGVNPILKPEEAEEIKVRNPQMIIPDAVLKCMAEGKPWYDIELNNELENLTRTQEFERQMQFMNAVGMGAQLDAALLEVPDLYESIIKMKDSLGIEGQVRVTKKEFNAMKKANQQAQAQAAEAEMGKTGSETAKNIAGAAKTGKEATTDV